MKFPVDLLADVSQAELERLAHNYMNNLLYSNPDSPEHLTLSDSTQVTIDISSVGFVPLYGSSDKQKILALFSPSDPFTAVALYLLDQWWAVDDILKTADPARDGALGVETVGERIVLYILNRVIYRVKEMSSEELPFLCHGEKDNAKILWNNGEAVGFYSVKPSGSLCSYFSTRSYQLPVMDSIFVRKCQRGKGFGLQMLEDFVLSFKEDCLGLRYPLTKSMYKVCEKYLCQYPGDTDLLWEVESIGGPNQRTNIACKIQAMDLSVSKSLSFTEESLITAVTEKDAVMEAVTTQIKEAESMECTVEIVEEVTVLRATRVSEPELPVAARGRSSGSKQRKIGAKITEDKSEKVIRIEDIEAETPREDQVSVQQKTELHKVSELVQTEAMFSVALEEKGKDVVDTAPEDAAATMSDKPATVLASQDLEEADITSTPTTEVPQVEDDATQDLNNTSHDLQITVENVASEIEEAEEECQKEDTAMLVESVEVLEVHKKAETLDKVGEATQIEVTNEKSEERVTQCVVSVSTHATSEDVEAGKTGRTVVKAIKTAQSETHRRRSQWHSKPEEGVKEETTAQDGGRVLRGRTCMTTPTPKCKYTQHSQKVCEELEKEVDEVAENEVSTTEVVEEFALNEGEEPEENTTTKEDVVAAEKLRQEKRQLEDEQLTNEEEIEKQEEPGVEDTVMKGSFTELPGTTDGSEKEPKGDEVETSVIQYKQEVSDDEIEEPPVVQKRALRARRKVTPKPMPAKQSKRQEEEYTEKADLGAGSSVSEEKADEQTTDKQMEEHYQVEQEETVDKTEEEISTEELTVGEKGTIPKAEEAAENVPQSEVNVEESKVVQKEEETKGETENVSLMDVDKDEEADDMIQEPDTVAAASETVIPDEVLDEAATPVAEKNQEKAIGSKIPKLQKATVILVDLKTTCHHLSVKEAEETPVDEECVAPEKEQMELTAAEEKDISSCIAEEQTPVTETLVLEEEDRGEKQYSTDKSVDAIAEADTAKKEELEECRSDHEKEESCNVDEEQNEAEESPVIETRVLRSGIKTVEASCKSASRSNQQQEEDHIEEGITVKEVDETETGIVEVEGEIKAMAKDAVTVTVPVEEKQFASVSAHIPETTDIPVVDDAEENLQPAEVDEAMSLGEEEAPVAETRALRSGTKTVTATPRHKKTRTRTQEDEQDAENSEEEEPAVTTRTLRRGRIAASATPKAKSRRTRKQINKQEEEQMGEEESQSVEKMGEEDGEPFKEAAVEKTDKEMEENIEEETGEKVKEEAAFEREECLESEIDVEEGKAVTEEGQDVVEEQSKAISKTFAEREVETSGKECNERKPVIGGEEVELPSVAVTRSLRSCGKTSKASPKTKSKKQQDEEKEEGGASAEKSSDGDEPPAESRILRRGRKSVCRNHKQLQKEEEGPKEFAEEADVEEEEEAGLGSSEQPPTEGERVVGKAPEEDKIEAEKEELVTVEVEKEERIMTEEEENTAGVTAAADHLVQDSAILTASKEEATPSGEVGQSEEIAPQLSDLQSLTVVLVDLENPDHEVTMKAEETMAEEHVPGSPVGIEKTELEKMVGFEEEVDDAVTIQYTEEGRAVETAKEDVAESVDDKGEPIVTKTRTQRSRKQAVKATPRHKLERSRQKKGEEEKEEASEIIEEEPAVQVRGLRRGRKPIPASQRCPTKRTHKQLQEEAEEGGEESTAIEAREAEEEDKQAEEQQLMIDQDKGERLEEKDATQQVENIEPEIGVEKEDTVTDEAVIQQEAPEEGQASSTETVANENPEAPVGQSADEGKNSDDIAEEAVRTQDTMERKQSASTSEVEETTAGESAQVTLLTAKDNKAKGASVEKEAPVIELRVLRSGEKTMRAITKSKAKKKKDDEQETGATGEKSTEGDGSTVETRVLRKGRRSAASTHWRTSKRARTQFQTEEEGEDKTTPAEEMQVEETKAMLEEAEEKQESTDEKIEESNEEEAAAQKEEKTEPGLVEMEKVEAVAEESLTEQDTVEEEQSAVLETCADRDREASVRGSAEKTPNTDEGKVPGEEEAPTLETRVLRNGRKAVKATPRSKSTKSQQEENEEEATVVEKGADKDEPAVETRVLRKGRRSASATPRRKSKRARTQCQLEEEGEEENSPAVETEGEEEEAGQELPEEKGEKAEEEGKSLEIEVKKEKDVEEEEVESAEGGESAVGDAEQMKVAMTEEAAGFEKEDNSVAAVDEPGTDMVKISSAEVEETNSAEEEETTVIEKSTADTEVGSDTVIAEEVALVKDASVVAEEVAPAVTRTLRKTQSSRRSRRQKDQGVVETQQQEEENLEDEGTQEAHQLTDEPPENRELNAKEQAETVETSPTGQGTGPPSEDTAEDQTKETADLIDDRVVESAGEEPATEEMKLPEEELSENKDKTVDSSVVQGRRLRRRMEADADKEEEKAEEIQLPERRSIRKRPRVDYRESYEDEGGETEAATDKEEEDKVGSDEDKDKKKAECSTDELIEKLEESSREENLHNNMGAIESTSEKGDVLNLVLDTDEEVKTAVISQEDMEDEQNVSEEDVEPIVIGKRVLRGRSVPSVIFTPQSKSRRRSAKVQKAEESV
ncbi:trichohyalin-like isoform X2 [Siniperca chuatsi]|uniref:trichohyalin-like isoform X2 n=1 Tax=Siniperca chuatsi TaxID=119488 RepID=UPI001CE2259A|nr:trichohyalin-like isoform X2 [Siniperca chuatsi]